MRKMRTEPDHASLCAPGAEATVVTVDVADGVVLRCVSFSPAESGNPISVILVTGLTTRIESFRGVLRELTRDFTVHYLETREKPSSHAPRTASFDMKAMAADVQAAVRRLAADGREYALAGYSLGATAVVEAWPDLDPAPRCLLLVEPTPVFRFPRWAPALVRWFGVPLYGVLRPFAYWYIRRRIIDESADPEMALIAGRALRDAEPWKLRRTVLSVVDYEAWDRLPAISRPTLVVAVSKDRLHVHEDIERVVASIDGCRRVDLETNERSHSAEMGRVARDFIRSVAGSPP